MINAEVIADEADVIIAGYAILKMKEGIKIINLNNRQGVALFRTNGELLETNMDDIELIIAKKYFQSSLKYMEE